jgi:SAM-dependent methyltransferase
MPAITAVDWHNRFLQQAQWTRELRRYLYPRAGLSQASRVLDVGCGTGVLEAELMQRSPAILTSVDISAANLNQAVHNSPGANYIQADAHQLPFVSDSFNLVLCHYLLLWVKDPQKVIMEMARVVRRGGAVLALAEPDYGGRVDYPPELSEIGRWQSESLSLQGADPEFGRRLPGLLVRAGLQQVESGILGGQWVSPPRLVELEMEWAVIQSDLAFLPGQPEREAAFKRLQALETESARRGERVLFVPTFYAWGKK